MTYTIPEAAKLTEIVGSINRVLQVGGSGSSTRLYWKINEYVRSGKMGKIVWGLISYNRNTREGMWDYPIPGVGDDHWPDAKVTPENLDWDMWLGRRPSANSAMNDISAGENIEITQAAVRRISCTIGSASCAR